LATSDKAEFERMCHPGQGGSFNQGPIAGPSTSTVTAVIEELSEFSGDEGNVEENKNLGTIAMTWPLAIVLGDSDSDDYSASPPLMILNLYWDANMLGQDGFFVMVKAMIDNGAHIILIRPDVVKVLRLE